MIKIAWKKFIYDHVWFGFWQDWDHSPFVPVKTLCWRWSPMWSDKLWPVRRYGEGPPGWWLRLFGMCVDDD